MTTFRPVHPVILCGGSGTRLWPLSRKSFPKQFVPLIGGKSLLSLTLERVAALNDAAEVTCVASEEHRFLVAESMDECAVKGSILLEPVARNTAPAIAIAALLAAKRSGGESLLLFCPADHHIPDSRLFAATVQSGLDAALDGAIVTFGVVPTFPSTAYGYIERGRARQNGSHAVARFIEKPAAQKAEAIILAGNALWNAGLFLARADAILGALEAHAPDILDKCRESMATAHEDGMFVRPEATLFGGARAESIDYAVMEPLSGQGGVAGIVVVAFQGAWSDVGSWNAVAELEPADAAGNRVSGSGVLIESSGTYVHAPYRPVVALGAHDMLVIDTPDALLVASRKHAEKVKQVVDELAAREHPQAHLHRKVARPWGTYDSIDTGQRFKVKRIVVKPGASLSLQKHHHRAEHWIVVQGTAEVTCGADVFQLTENESTFIPIGQVHRLKNPGRMPLELIEVQSGGYLEEDDIVRLEDSYGRLD